MLTVYFGNDAIKVRAKASDLVAKETKKGAEVERIDTDSYSPGILADLAGATSLFGSRTTYLIDTPSISQDFLADVIAHLPALAESPNTFIVIEEAMLAPEKKKFSKYADSIEEFKKPTTERFNAFSLADSLAKKDKRALWVGLQEASLNGVAAEEVIGIMWWQLKTLLLAGKTKTAKEADVKDFPYNKAKRALTNFKSGELEAISQSLLKLYHDGHSGRTDINLALEKWTLTI